ncbi:hypothetical protein MPER_09902 [Moniliophthora perniciosa FA553]|nr:hypothetical protein MPER_09902 [Moniliophthora perniciosa FA553]
MMVLRANDAADSIMWASSNPDNSHIASSSWDGTVRLWNATTGQQINTVCWLSWSLPSRRFLSRRETYRDGLSRQEGDCLAFGGAHRLGTQSGGTLRDFGMARGDELQYWRVKSCPEDPPSPFLEVNDVQFTARDLLVFKSTDGHVFTYDERTNRKETV